MNRPTTVLEKRDTKRHLLNTPSDNDTDTTAGRFTPGRGPVRDTELRSPVTNTFSVEIPEQREVTVLTIPLTFTCAKPVAGRTPRFSTAGRVLAGILISRP